MEEDEDDMNLDLEDIKESNISAIAKLSSSEEVYHARSLQPNLFIEPTTYSAPAPAPTPAHACCNLKG